MGAFTGSMTFKQYLVRDDLPAQWKELFQQGIERHVFTPLDPGGEAERAIGWCSPHFPLDLELDTNVYLYTDYIILGLRVDAWNVPASLLKIYSESEARRVMAEQNKDGLSRYERAEIKERVKLELRRKTLPSIKTVEMVWNWQEGIVRFFSSSQKLNLDFMDLFEDSFTLSLMPEGVYTSAQNSQTGLLEAERERLEFVEPSAFVDVNTITEAMREI
jgi:recombination associated protein RdgC